MEITDVNTLFGAYPSRHPNHSADTLAEMMLANHVDYALALSTLGLFHHDRVGNEETMNVCRRIQNLVPVATIDPRGYWGQPDALATVASGYEMYRFFPQDQGWPVDSAAFRDILEALPAIGAKPLMISVRVPGDVTRTAMVTSGYGNAVILEGVNADTLSEAISVMRTSQNIYIETHALRSPEALSMLRQTVGVGRVLFGSRAPGNSLGASLRFVRGAGLPDADQAAILSGNAAAIWHGGAA